MSTALSFCLWNTGTQKRQSGHCHKRCKTILTHKSPTAVMGLLHTPSLNTSKRQDSSGVTGLLTQVIYKNNLESNIMAPDIVAQCSLLQGDEFLNWFPFVNPSHGPKTYNHPLCCACFKIFETLWSGSKSFALFRQATLAIAHCFTLLTGSTIHRKDAWHSASAGPCTRPPFGASRILAHTLATTERPANAACAPQPLRTRHPHTLAPSTPHHHPRSRGTTNPHTTCTR